tara:strand:+ start:21193 stop:22119 length:927 start_codon:yes stop_codon:yes gene_type:complete
LGQTSLSYGYENRRTQINTLSLFIGSTVIWGTTWLALKAQAGVVDPSVSIAYRFLIGSCLFFILHYIRTQKFLPKLPKRMHLMVFFQGIFMFGLAYEPFFPASKYMASGLLAVIFSAIALPNIFLGALFFKTPIRPQVILGSLLGIAGVVATFWKDVETLDIADNAVYGILLGLTGTLLASFGQIIAAKVSRSGVRVTDSAPYAMLYGALFMLIYCIAKGETITIDWSISYVAPTLYLGVMGSFIAFWAYLTLIGRIGPGRAAYVLVATPIIALCISSIYEGYTWTIATFIGMSLVVAGNVLVLRGKT